MSVCHYIVPRYIRPAAPGKLCLTNGTTWCRLAEGNETIWALTSGRSSAVPFPLLCASIIEDILLTFVPRAGLSTSKMKVN